MKYKIKIITGYRKDQEISINANEAHKAYYLFAHPNERGVFENGVALVGADIKQILPDYNGTMGWNPTHTLDSYDMDEIIKLGVDKKLNEIMRNARLVAKKANAQELTLPLNALLKTTYAKVLQLDTNHDTK